MLKLSPEKRGQKIMSLMDRLMQAHWKKREALADKVQHAMRGGPFVLGVDKDRGLLSDALNYNLTPIVDYCLEHDISLGLKGKYSEIPLVLALWRGHYDIASILIGKGVDVNVSCAQGKAALMYALSGGAVDIAKTLIGKGVSPFTVTSGGFDCLTAAIDSNEVNTVDYALTLGLPILHSSGDRNHYLAAAARTGNFTIFERLLKAGMSPDYDNCSHLYNEAQRNAWRAHAEADTRIDIYLYERIEAFKKDKLRQLAENEQAERTGWKQVDSASVSHVSECRIGAYDYRIVEIFNFRAGVKM
jgi:hypothetical protein